MVICIRAAIYQRPYELLDVIPIGCGVKNACGILCTLQSTPLQSCLHTDDMYDMCHSSGIVLPFSVLLNTFVRNCANQSSHIINFILSPVLSCLSCFFFKSSVLMSSVPIPVSSVSVFVNGFPFPVVIV
jgi:hypothetical protein